MLPNSGKLRVRPAWVCLTAPSHVNHCEKYMTALDFKQDIIAVNPSGHRSHFQAMKNVLFWKLRLKPSGEAVGVIRNFRRVRNDLPRLQHLNRVRNGQQ